MRISWSLGDWLHVLRTVPFAGHVALTFDDGPHPATTPALLELLRRHNAHATFFLSGARASTHPHLLAPIVAAGHAVYGHGWEHIPLDRENPDRIHRDLDRVENLLATLRPTPTPYLVRLPYNAGFRRPWVHRAIKSWRADAQLVHWSLSLEDVLIPGEYRRGIALADSVRARVDLALASPALERAIVLLHEEPFDLGSAGEPVAPCLLAALLPALAAAGLRTALVSASTTRGWASRFVLI